MGFISGFLRNHALLTAVLLLTCLPAAVLRAETRASRPLTLAENREVYLLGPSLDIFVDENKSATIDDIATGRHDAAFKASGEKALGFGQTRAAVWARFTLKNEFKEPRDFIVVQNENAYSVEFFARGPNAWSPFFSRESGQKVPFSDWKVQNKTAAFRLTLFPGQEQTFYWRHTEIGNMVIDLELLSPAAFFYRSVEHYHVLGVFYGLMVAMLFYNLFLYLSIRDSSYLWYLAYILTFGLVNYTLNGLSYQYLWPDFSEWNSRSMAVLAAGSQAAIILFTKSFLNTRKSVPWLNHVLNLLLGLSLILFGYYAIRDVGQLDMLWVNVLIMNGLLLNTIVVIRCLVLGQRQARFFLISFAALILGGVLLILRNLGILPSNAFTAYGAQVGGAMQMILLSIALADRINILRSEKASAQAEALRNQQLAVENLKKADKLKDEFLANTSHELRTPLNGIIGLAESLVEGVGGPVNDVTRQNLSMIVYSGKRLFSLVNDILDFSKLKNMELVLQKKSLGIREITEVVLTVSRPLIGRKELKLINGVSADLPAVLGDENRLQQIMHNLVGNAIKFTESGSVVVSARVLDGRGEQPAVMEVTVADTGIGVPADKLEVIFNAFEQADASTARRYGGTGLGLSNARQLVELHGGTIRAESTVGEGSSFIFTLPLSTETLEPGWQNRIMQEVSSISTAGLQTLNTTGSFSGPHGEQAEDDRIEASGTAVETRVVRSELPNHNGAIRVLIVDDEPVNQQVLMNFLSMEHCAVRQAGDGSEALSIMKNGFVPDIVLLDIMMPQMTGYEVCERLRREHPANELPIVMLTAKNQAHDLVQAIHVGANDYLTKPFSRSELLARMKVHLELSSINIAYGRFVPHEFLRFLDHDSIVEVKLGDQVQKEMTVLFVDIRSFTELSESMTPRENFNFLNSYLKRVGPIIRENNGFVDKYIGDAIMALYPGSPDDALVSANQILDAVDGYNLHRGQQGFQTISVGIGIHSGTLMLGTIGEEKRMEGTVISDAVNLASRLEGLTKAFDTQIIVSGQTLERLQNPARFQTRFLGRTRVKGKKETVSVYELYDRDPEAIRQAKAGTREELRRGLDLLYKGNFAEAIAIFQKIAERNPHDRPVRRLLERAGQQMDLSVETVEAKL